MVDVTVYGAGIFGLSVAWSCVKLGAKVQVIDPNGVAAGSSGGIVGALAPHTPENWNDKKEFQFQSLIMAEDYWSEVAEVSGQSQAMQDQIDCNPSPISVLTIWRSSAKKGRQISGAARPFGRSNLRPISKVGAP